MNDRHAGRSPHITRDGWDTLNTEQDTLWAKRRKVVAHLSAAAAEGDRSENAEYIYRKKQLREIDRRIRYLQVRLPKLHVVAEMPDDPDKVRFGAWVTLEDEDGNEVTHRIVGADEFDPTKRWISIDSPVARALLGHGLDDEITVTTPTGSHRYWITDIRYQ